MCCPTLRQTAVMKKLQGLTPNLLNAEISSGSLTLLWLLAVHIKGILCKYDSVEAPGTQACVAESCSVVSGSDMNAPVTFLTLCSVH